MVETSTADRSPAFDPSRSGAPARSLGGRRSDPQAAASDGAAPSQAVESRRRAALRLARIAAAVVIATGLLVLAGWTLDIAALKSVAGGWATMKPNTALCLCLVGVALWLRAPAAAGAREWLALALASLAGLIGALTTLEYLLGLDLGIDGLLLGGATAAEAAGLSGRMAPATAAGIVLLAATVLILDYRPATFPAQYTAGVVVVLAVLALVGYGYDVEELYRFGPYSSVAAHTAFAFLVAALGLLLSRPDRGALPALMDPGSGGALLRRLIPAVVAIPLVMGWLRLRGQWAGLYGTEFGVALFAVSNALVFVALVALTARSVSAAEAERQRSEASLRASEAASRLKSEFLANMSHELRTPLNAVIGFSEMLHDGKLGPVSAQQRDVLGDVLTSSRHLLGLINDVLDLSKVESGTMQFRPARVEPARLAREVISVLRSLAGSKGIVVEAEVEAGLDEIVIDTTKLKQVLYNYLSNALKFTPEGGRVTVRMAAEGGSEFRLEVEDTGIGIRPEDLPRLFVEFQQLDAGAAKQYAGTGLGLAVTKRIVEAQGGRVGVRSQPGRGSVFHAVLPREAPAQHGSTDADRRRSDV